MDIDHLLNQTVLVQNPSGGRDKHGQAALGSSTSMPARFERTYTTIVTADREREPIHARVFTTQVINNGAKVIYSGDAYRVMQDSQKVHGDGTIHHYTTLLQLWSFGS